MLSSLKSYKDSLIGCKVVYLTDSQSCDIICRKGSTNMSLHIYAEQIHKICIENKIDFVTAWISRCQNQEADYMSKAIDPDKWS